MITASYYLIPVYTCMFAKPKEDLFGTFLYTLLPPRP